LVLRPKPRNRRGDFEAQITKPELPVLRPKPENPCTTLVLRLNQETRAPNLHVPGADRTRRHPTSRPSGHRVPDLCDHPRSSATGLLLLPRSSSLHAMPHLLPAHHETSKRNSLNEAKVKEKQNKTIPDSNSNLAMSMTHHNQTKKRTTWFLILFMFRSFKLAANSEPMDEAFLLVDLVASHPSGRFPLEVPTEGEF
jgi:hypothetical protein